MHTLLTERGRRLLSPDGEKLAIDGASFLEPENMLKIKMSDGLRKKRHAKHGTAMLETLEERRMFAFGLTTTSSAYTVANARSSGASVMPSGDGLFARQ